MPPLPLRSLRVSRIRGASAGEAATAADDQQHLVDQPGRASNVDRLHYPTSTVENLRWPLKPTNSACARTALSSVRMTDAEAAAVQKTPNRVTLDSMLAKVDDEDTCIPSTIPHMTICVLTMRQWLCRGGQERACRSRELQLGAWPEVRPRGCDPAAMAHWKATRCARRLI